MAGGKPLSMFKEAVSSFSSDDAMTFAAAVALYAALSLAPLLVIFLSIASYLGPETQQALISQIEKAAGPNAGSAVHSVIQNINTLKVSADVSFVLGVVTVAFAAMGVFLQVQHGLNRIWGVQPKRTTIKGWLLKRVWTLLFILAVAVLLLASVAATSLVKFIAGGGAGWWLTELLISLALFVLLFALIFKYMPDAKVAWKEVWLGAAVTAVLFTAGKWGMGIYFSYSSVGSAYGAAGSLIVMLLWVYYSAIIFFFGAELTQAYARAYGTRIVPETHAEWSPEGKAQEKERRSSGGTPPRE